MDPQLWWAIARASGLMAWWLLSAAVVWGLLVTTGLAPRFLGRINQQIGIHRFLSGLSVAFVLVHMLALWMDEWLEFSLFDLLVPMASSYRPGAVAWGVAATYLMAAIVGTSLARRHLPHWLWRRLHYAAFPMFVLATMHGLAAGTDVTHPVVISSGILLAGFILFLSTYRLVLEPVSVSKLPVPTKPPEVREAATASRVAVKESSLRSVTVTEVRHSAPDVAVLRLGPADGLRLPAWAPGAHIDLVLPSGAIRQYSLCGDPEDLSSYRIAVLKEAAGRGGSIEVHGLREGQVVAIRGPRQAFPLVLAKSYLFVAGGIGVTALLPMVNQVEELGLRWRMLYGARSRHAFTFADQLLTLDAGQGRIDFVAEDTDGRPDLAKVLTNVPGGTALYGCGPEGLIAALEGVAAKDFPELGVHVERFGRSKPLAAPSPAGVARDAPFEVELARSGRVLQVPGNQSLLNVLRAVVPTTPSSCEQGFCGVCELRVLGGVPDHRDQVLAGNDRFRTDVVFPCVSRARSERLVVDL